jgi:OmpA-OmpF porin, OOP family
MKHVPFIFTLLVGSFISTAALAQTYVGITGGASRLDDCNSSFDSCDKAAFGLKVYGGYKFTPNIALEAAYADLGKFNASGPSGSFSGSTKLSAFSVGGAFFYELVPNVTAIARLGLASGKVKLVADIPSKNFSTSDTENKINPYLGVGLGYSLTPSWSINGTLDLNRMKFDGITKNTFMLGAGISYGF